MFNNIGSKIKNLAQVVCWIGIALSVLVGIIVMSFGGFFSGIIVIVAGSLVSWIGSFFTYGFGELIESCQEIERNTNQILMNTNKQPSTIAEKLAILEKWKSQGIITEEEYINKRSQL